MALQVCVGDLVPHAIGAPRCPECGCEEAVLQGSPEHEALLAEKAEKAAPKKPAAKQSGEKPGGTAKPGETAT